MTWNEAFCWSIGWYALVCGFAAGLTWWVRARPPTYLPAWLPHSLDAFVFALPFALPFALARFSHEARLFVIGVVLSIIAGPGLLALRRRGLTDRAFDVWVNARRRSARLPGLSIGIVRGEELVYARAFGVADQETSRPATLETIYRVGSVTKVFTTTLLAILRDQGTLRLDDAVESYLPQGVRLPSDPRGVRLMTLRHLATHSSGLPRLPVNPTPRGDDPYGGYTVEALYEGLARTRLDFPTGADYSYSNLGVGLLGHVLERAAGKSYDELLKQYLLVPLGMSDTNITLGLDQERRLATGYKEEDPTRRAADWDTGCLAAAGALVSTIPDLAKFLALQLRAGHADVVPVSGGTLTELHSAQQLARDWTSALGLGWHLQHNGSQGDWVWHNGRLDGFASWVSFLPKFQVGVIVLTNCGRSVDSLGQWLQKEARLRFGARRPVELDPQVEVMARALANHLAAPPTDALAELFNPAFLAAIPFTRIKPLFEQLYERLGPCQGVAVSAVEAPRRGNVVFRFANSRTSRCELEIDGTNPPRLVYLQMK
jgi:CubicO group peptidase (beta-lactamase class C family)